MSHMKKRQSFFLKLAGIAIICVIADAGMGSLLHHFYANIRHGEQGRVNYAVDTSEEDVLVLGSSRASHTYVASMMAKQFQLSCYNAGKDKQGIFYCLAMLKMVVARHAPSYIILDVNPYAFAENEKSLDVLYVLLPYYRQHPEIRPIINKRSSWEQVKTLSSLYCYNSLPLQIAFNNLSGGRDADAVNGYVPLYRAWNNSADTARLIKGLTAAADSSLVNAFKEIVAVSATHGSKLIVVASPFFIPMAQKSPTLQKCDEICRLNRIPFFDYSGLSPFVHNKQLFADGLHLNHIGAFLFSEKFFSDLQSGGFIKNPAVLTP